MKQSQRKQSAMQPSRRFYFYTFSPTTRDKEIVASRWDLVLPTARDGPRGRLLPIVSSWCTIVPLVLLGLLLVSNSVFNKPQSSEQVPLFVKQVSKFHLTPPKF